MMMMMIQKKESVKEKEVYLQYTSTLTVFIC